MSPKKLGYFGTRELKRYIVYISFIGFGLLFWWASENALFGPMSPDGPASERINAWSSSGSPSVRKGRLRFEQNVDRVLKGESLNSALSRNGLSQQDAFLIASILRRKINLRAIQPGDVLVIEKNAFGEAPGKQEKSQEWAFDAFELVRTDSSGLPVRYRIVPKKNAVSTRKNSRDASDFDLIQIEAQVTTSEEMLEGEISTSLYDGILLAGGDPGLVNRFSELFGWQVDFYRETQPGDGFKVVVEKKFADGRFVGYGLVKAAEYSTRGKAYRGFYYESSDGKLSGYFDENGFSLEKSFFKSPMQLTRITSKYGQRFHPVLGRVKKHNGVDYGAPSGTPFWAVADGTVIEARYSPSAGNMIRVKHNNGFVTEYFHASRIAKGVRAGAKVRQKQVIGYVGTTGRSTGPHLHFGMMQDKKYIDPSKQKIAIEVALPKKEALKYRQSIVPMLTQFAETNSRRT